MVLWTSRKFWLLVLDVVVSTITYFVGKYIPGKKVILINIYICWGKTYPWEEQSSSLLNMSRVELCCLYSYFIDRWRGPVSVHTSGRTSILGFQIFIEC